MTTASGPTTAGGRVLGRSGISAVLEVPLDPDRNTLWCPTFELAWDRMRSLVGAGALSLDASALATALQARRPREDDLVPGSFVALAGCGGEGILDAVRTTVRAAFGPEVAPTQVPARLAPDSLLAYAMLVRALRFPVPLVRDPMPLRFRGARVAGFGLHAVRTPEQVRQVLVHHHTAPGDFTVELQTDTLDDRLVVARTAAPGRLLDAVRAVLATLRDTPGELGSEEPLVVPLLDIDLLRSYTELVGMRLTSGPYRDGRIEWATQTVRFALDETGAALRSEAALAVSARAVRGDPPRRFVCDGPFMVLLLRRGGVLPYFVAWFGNDELLQQRD